MRKITFTGQLKNIEFASRWKRESLARTIRSGKETSQIIAEDIKKGIPRQTAVDNQKSQLAFDKDAATRDRDSLNNAIEKSKNKGTFNELTKRKRSGKTSRNTSRVKKAVKGLKTSRFFREKLPKSGTQPKTYKQANKLIDKTVDDFNKAVKAPSNVVNSPSSSTAKPLLSSKSPSKSSNLLTKAGAIAAKHPGKLALGISAVGVGTALGMRMYRKMRSDKGKKRGNYRK